MSDDELDHYPLISPTENGPYTETDGSDGAMWYDETAQIPEFD